jgi:hypothetical protein
MPPEKQEAAMNRNPVRDFGATKDEIQRGFERIMSGVGMDAATRQQVYDIFFESQVRGSSKLIIKAAKSIQKEFSWPFYDKWKAFFERHQLWPESWDARPFGCEEDDDVEESTPEDELRFKALLLLRSINTAVYEEARMHQRDEIMKDTHLRHGLVCFGSDACPVEKQIAMQYNMNKINGFPPFFPGDGCSVSASSIQTIKRDGFTAETYKRVPLD